MGPGSYFYRNMYFQSIAASGFVTGGIKAVEPPESRGPSLRYTAFMQGLRERSMRAFDCLDGDKRAIATAC